MESDARKAVKVFIHTASAFILLTSHAELFLSISLTAHKKVMRVRVMSEIRWKTSLLYLSVEKNQPFYFRYIFLFTNRYPVEIYWKA